MTTQTVVTLTQDERAIAQSVVGFWLFDRIGYFDDPSEVTLAEVGDFLTRLGRIKRIGPSGDAGLFCDVNLYGEYPITPSDLTNLRELAAWVEDSAEESAEAMRDDAQRLLEAIDGDWTDPKFSHYGSMIAYLESVRDSTRTMLGAFGEAE